MDTQKSSLCVSLHNIEFAKEYHYFITVQLGSDGEKRRTDVSALVSNPIFTASVFVIPLSQFKIDINDIIFFQAFVVTDRDENNQNGLGSQGQARLLGECQLELGPFTIALTDISGMGVRQHLKFMRVQGDKNVTVGRFIVNLKLVGEQLIPIENADQKPLESDEIFHPLPASDPFMNFAWRLRVDVRQATYLPLSTEENGAPLPTSYVELGWSLYEQRPNDYDIYLTKLEENNRHPIWNQQFLIPNPQNIPNKEGFLYVSLKDQNRRSGEPIEQLYLPLSQIKPFIPINFEIFCNESAFGQRPRLFISITLEMPNRESFLDELCDIIVKMVHYDPLPYASRAYLLMSLNSHNGDQVPFYILDLKGPKTISQNIIDAQLNTKPIFISSIMKIPPHQVESVYNAVAVFTLPKIQFDTGIAFHLAARDDSVTSNHSMPNVIVGYTEIVDPVLKKIYYAKEQKQALVPITWAQNVKIYPQFSSTRCLIELACIDSQDNNNLLIKPPSRLNSRVGKASELPPPKTPDLKAPSAGDKQKWEILSRELSQKQEIVHRLMKEVDDKTESLKITGVEIVDLRRQIKLLQSENQILRKRMAHEEGLEIQSIITKEIAQMPMEELRQKIIKVAQAYRNERVRNEEFEKALKAAQKDITNSRQLQVELEQMQRLHQENAQKMLAMQQEIQKVSIYKETIKKQEKVINKLEKLMETSLKDAQKARQAQLELEQLRSENISLQKQLKGIVYGEDIGELEKYKNECMKLEKIVARMKEELRNQRPISSGGADWEQEKMELEINLQKTNSRVEALQDEMTYNAKNYAKEIAQYKLIIAEKQALIDSLSY